MFPPLRHFAGLLAAALLAGPAAALEPGQTVMLENADSSLFLAVVDKKAERGSNVILWSAGKGKSGRTEWRVVAGPGGTVKLQFGGEKLFLAIGGSSRGNGGNAILWRDQGQADIRWRAEQAGRGCFTLHNAHSGRLLSVGGKGAWRGANVYQWGRSADRRGLAIWCPRR